MLLRCIMTEYSTIDIKLYLFGNAIFNFVLSAIYNKYAIGMFKDKRSEIAVFIFGIIYIIMIFYNPWFYSQTVWKVIIIANTIGAVANLSLHRQIDTFWWLNLNDPNKAVIYYLVYNQFVLKQ